MKTKAKYLIEELKKVNALLEANKEAPVKEILLYMQDKIERRYAYGNACELVDDSMQIDIKNKTVSGLFFNVSDLYEYTDLTTSLEGIGEDLLDEMPEEIEEEFGIKVELDYDIESGPEIENPYEGSSEYEDEDDDDSGLIETKKLIISIK